MTIWRGFEEQVRALARRTLRALIREWKDWCSIDCIAGEQLFACPSYLLEVISKAGERTQGSQCRAQGDR